MSDFPSSLNILFMRSNLPTSVGTLLPPSARLDDNLDSCPLLHGREGIGSVLQVIDMRNQRLDVDLPFVYQPGCLLEVSSCLVITAYNRNLVPVDRVGVDRNVCRWACRCEEVYRSHGPCQSEPCFDCLSISDCDDDGVGSGPGCQLLDSGYGISRRRIDDVVRPERFCNGKPVILDVDYDC